MALEDLISAMEKEVNAEIDSALSEARDTAASKLQKAKQQAEELKNARMKQARIDFAAEETRMQNAATLATAQEAHQVKKELVERAFEQATDAIRKIRNTPEYTSILESLVQEVRDAVDAELIWQVDSRDEDTLRSILGEDAVIEPKLNCVGGVIGVTQDGRIRADNTFEARFHKARELYITRMMTILTE